jgi:hypothetical protein
MGIHQRSWTALTVARLTLATLATVGPACKSGPETSPSVPAPSATTAKAAPSSAAGTLRCGDFFSKAEVAALGVDASRYKEDETQANPLLGVPCDLGSVDVVVFHGNAYTSMRAGDADALKKGMVKRRDGAAVGSDSFWSGMGPYSTLSFFASSKGFAANVTGKDAALVEKVGKALDAKMK